MRNQRTDVLECSAITPTIRAEFVGSKTCTAAGHCGQGNTPVLALCRTLIAAGMDADAALEVFRRGTLALRVRSVGEAAQLTVRDNRFGEPQFRRGETASLGDAGASPIRQKPRHSGSTALLEAASQQQGVG
jgi:hypothetical protein